MLSAGLRIVILSVHPFVHLSVCDTRSLWRNERTYCRYFDNTWKSNYSSLLTPTGWWAISHFTLNLRSKWPTSVKCKLWPISAYNVWTVRATEKCSVIANRKSITHFPMSYRWSAYVIPNFLKGWLKNRICRFCEYNSSSIESSLLQSFFLWKLTAAEL